MSKTVQPGLGIGGVEPAEPTPMRIRTVGHLLRVARKEQRVGQKALARHMGISKTTLCEREQAENLTVASIKDVAEALGYRVKIVLERPGEKPLYAELR